MTAMLLMACQETPEEQARRELAVAEEKRRIQKELHDANLNAVAHDCAREQAADHLDSHLGLFKLEPDFMVSVENVFWSYTRKTGGWSCGTNLSITEFKLALVDAGWNFCLEGETVTGLACY